MFINLNVVSGYLDMLFYVQKLIFFVRIQIETDMTA